MRIRQTDCRPALRPVPDELFVRSKLGGETIVRFLLIDLNRRLGFFSFASWAGGGKALLIGDLWYYFFSRRGLETGVPGRNPLQEVGGAVGDLLRAGARSRLITPAMWVWSSVVFKF